MCREDDRAKLLAAMDAIQNGAPLPEGTMAHVSRETTQADWDALDPDSFDTECRDCGAYYEGKLAPKGQETAIQCPECGSRNHGAVGSPAGALHLAMHDPRFWD